MNEFTAQQVETALQTAMFVTSPDKSNPILVPVSHATGVLLLHNLAGAILRGEYALVPRGEFKEAELDADDMKPGGTSDDDD